MSNATLEECRSIMASAIGEGEANAAQLHALVDDTDQLIRQQVGRPPSTAASRRC